MGTSTWTKVDLVSDTRDHDGVRSQIYKIADEKSYTHHYDTVKVEINRKSPMSFLGFIRCYALRGTGWALITEFGSHQGDDDEANLQVGLQALLTILA